MEVRHLSTGQRFVLVAIVLLIFSAVVLALGREEMANSYAILAYYFLVIGVLNLLIEHHGQKKVIARRSLSCVLLALMIRHTPEIMEYFPYLDLIIFSLAFYIVIRYVKASAKDRISPF